MSNDDLDDFILVSKNSICDDTVYVGALDYPRKRVDKFITDDNGVYINPRVIEDFVFAEIIDDGIYCTRPDLDISSLFLEKVKMNLKNKTFETHNLYLEGRPCCVIFHDKEILPSDRKNIVSQCKKNNCRSVHTIF